MGLEICNVLSEERHYGPFICVICQNLVGLDGVVTTRCSHCFCRPCLEQWIDRAAAIGGVYTDRAKNTCHCPTCNEDMLHSAAGGGRSRGSGGGSNNNNNNNNFPYMLMRNFAVSVQPIQTCQPLAYRLLNRIYVRCPLQGVQCGWKGDYGDLQSHLLSQTSHDITNENCTIVQPGPTTTNNNKGRDNNNHHNNNRDTTATCNGAAGAAVSAARNSTHGASNNGKAAGDDVWKKEQREQRLRIHALALSYKEEANGKFTSGYHREACELYTQAIGLLLPVYQQYNDDRRDDNDGDDDDENHNHENYCSGSNNNNNSEATTAVATKKATPKETVKNLLAILYSNRATTHYHGKDFVECTNDCHRVLELYGDHVKARVRMGQALIQLGLFEKACNFYGDDGNNSDNRLVQEMQRKAHKLHSLYVKARHDLEVKGDYGSAKALYGKILLEMSSCSFSITTGAATAPSTRTGGNNPTTQTARIPHIMLGAAKADLGLGLTDASLRVCMQVLKQYPQLVEGYELRGMIAFFMCDFENAMKYYNESLRLDPDCDRAKRSRKMIQQLSNWIATARTHSFHRRFVECQEVLTWIINECNSTSDRHHQNLSSSSSTAQLLVRLPPKSPLYALLYTQRAEAKLRCKQYQSCLKDCSIVLYSQDDHVQAWICKFQAYHGLGQHERALEEIIDLMYHRKSRSGNNSNDGEEVGWGASNERIRQEYKKADFLVRKTKRPDYYGMLGVSSIASTPEIKKAYKGKAREYHPDRLSSSRTAATTKKEEREQTKRFQLLGEGLEVLCDDFKRQLYDEGYDLEAINERVAAAQRAAHR